jgi:hypothetical protein
MGKSIAKKDVGNYRIKIYNDTDPKQPENENDDAFLVYGHRDFTVLRDGFNARDVFEGVERKKTYKGYWVFKVYAYIHGGVALSVGSHNFPDARWDVSMNGFALVKRQKGYYIEEKALILAKSIVEEWNQYLSDDVYGYKIFNLGLDGKKGDEVDSCWGFYGEDECMSEAVSLARGFTIADEMDE